MLNEIEYIGEDFTAKRKKQNSDMKESLVDLAEHAAKQPRLSAHTLNESDESSLIRRPIIRSAFRDAKIS